jgi:hypothetical protein
MYANISDTGIALRPRRLREPELYRPPGSGPPIKAGEFILGYPDEEGPPSNLPQPEILPRNASYMAYRRLQQHVVHSATFCASKAARLQKSRSCLQQN